MRDSSFTKSALMALNCVFSRRRNSFRPTAPLSRRARLAGWMRLQRQCAASCDIPTNRQENGCRTWTPCCWLAAGAPGRDYIGCWRTLSSSSADAGRSGRFGTALQPAVSKGSGRLDFRLVLTSRSLALCEGLGVSIDPPGAVVDSELRARHHS